MLGGIAPKKRNSSILVYVLVNNPCYAWATQMVTLNSYNFKNSHECILDQLYTDEEKRKAILNKRLKGKALSYYHDMWPDASL